MVTRFFFIPRCNPHRLLQCSRSYGYVHVPKKTEPHLLGHGSVWRKCFVVHPCTQDIDCVSKYQWLTKSRLVTGLPQVFDKIPLPDQSVVNDFQNRLIDYLSHTVLEKRNWRPFCDINFGMLQAVLPSLWQLGGHYSHLKHSYWSVNTSVECFWRNHGRNYVTFTNPLAILYVPSSLQLFHFNDNPVIGEEPPTDLGHIHLGLFERSFDEVNVFGGNKRLSPYPLVHTLLINERTNSTSQQTTAHALMQLFAQSAAQTVQNGHPLDTDLTYPLSTQAILTNGRDMTFACYQLNTLNFTQDSSDMDNIMWIGPTLQLFSNEETTPTVNEECVQLMIKFLLNRTLRKGPSMSGFRNKRK